MLNTHLILMTASGKGSNYCVPAQYDALTPQITAWDFVAARAEELAGNLPISNMKGMSRFIAASSVLPVGSKELHLHLPAMNGNMQYEVPPGGSAEVASLGLMANYRGDTPFASIDKAHLALPWLQGAGTEDKAFLIELSAYATDIIDPMHFIRYNLNHEKTEFVSIFIRPDRFAGELAASICYRVNGEYMESAPTYFDFEVGAVVLPTLSLYVGKDGNFGLYADNELTPRLQFNLPAGTPSVCENTTIDLCFVDPGSVPYRNTMLNPGDGIRITNVVQKTGQLPG